MTADQHMDELAALELSLQQYDDMLDVAECLRAGIASGRISLDQNAITELDGLSLENRRTRQEVLERLIALGWTPPRAHESPRHAQ